MIDSKPWWQSKTVIASLIGFLFIALKVLGFLPEGLTQESVVEAVLTVTSVLAVIFRVKSTTVIGSGG